MSWQAKGFGSSTPTHRSGASLTEMELSPGAVAAMEMRRRGSVPCTTTPMSPRATGNPMINTALNSPRASMRKSKSSTSLTALTPQGSGSTLTSPNQSARPSSLGRIQLLDHDSSHTHNHTLTYPLSLVLVVMMRSKGFKTSRFVLMLIL